MGEHFLKTLLSQGGSRKAMDLFIDFRGRKPDNTALLKHSGLLVKV
jgi:oligopeptidase A